MTMWNNYSPNNILAGTPNVMQYGQSSQWGQYDFTTPKPKQQLQFMNQQQGNPITNNFITQQAQDPMSAYKTSWSDLSGLGKWNMGMNMVGSGMNLFSSAMGIYDKIDSWGRNRKLLDENLKMAQNNNKLLNQTFETRAAEIARINQMRENTAKQFNTTGISTRG